MNFSKQAKFFLVIGLHIAVILGIAGFKLAVVTTGTQVMLQIAPVDPRDPLRGDYFTYQFPGLSQINSTMFSYTPVMVGDQVYVPLYKAGKYWTISSGISKQLPQGLGGASKCTSYDTKGGCEQGGITDSSAYANQDYVFIKGTVDKVTQVSSYRQSPSSQIQSRCADRSRCLDTQAESGYIDVKYGIEQYFISEGSGTNAQLLNREAAIQVSIDNAGNAVVRKLFIDGKAWQ